MSITDEKLTKIEEHILKQNGFIDILGERVDFLVEECKFMRNHVSTLVSKVSKMDDRLDELIKTGITAKAQVTTKQIGFMGTIVASITAIILALI